MLHCRRLRPTWRLAMASLKRYTRQRGAGFVVSHPLLIIAHKPQNWPPTMRHHLAGRKPDLVIDEQDTKPLREVLTHLYDAAYLQEHPLARTIADSLLGEAGSVQGVRRFLLEIIEELRPGQNLPFSAKEWRPYRVLFMRYVQQMPIPRILEELAISNRQLQREHARALRAIANILSERLTLKGEKVLVNESGLSTAVRNLVAGAKRETLDVGALLEGVLGDIERLAAMRQVSFSLDGPPLGATLYGDRGLLRQILLNILSYLMGNIVAREITLKVEASEEEVSFLFSLPLTHVVTPDMIAHGELPERLALARQLTEAIGGQLALEARDLRLSLPTKREVVLVVDDNRAVIDMLRRFLTDSRYRVLGAQSAEEALELANTSNPLLIMLDVMMPSHDGWEVLQHLKHHPNTMNIPVVICSILDEEELAASLGADDYLRKPLTREAVIQLLSRWERNMSTRT